MAEAAFSIGEVAKLPEVDALIERAQAMRHWLTTANRMRLRVPRELRSVHPSLSAAGSRPI